MARQNIRPNPSERLFEAYMDFSGGLNSQTSNEKLKDKEYPVLENVDLSGRGSAKRRTGRVSIGGVTGTSQGMFFYYRLSKEKPDLILAISGKLYVKRFDGTTLTQIDLTDNGTAGFTFQNTLHIEATQYGEDLFVATGTKLCEIHYDIAQDKWVGQTVTPYKPTALEALYIGTNGIADNPDAYVADGVASGADVETVGIKPSTRSGTMNIATTMVAYANVPSGYSGTIDYKWEYKKISETSYTLGRDWTTGATGKTWDFKATVATNYDIKVTVRKTGTTTPTPDYTLADYQINVVENKVINNTLPVTGIQKCRKILLHWDHILLSEDDTNPYQVYVSDLNNPRYYPVTNTIKFDTGKREPITAIVRYQDMLVFFTKTTIQTLTGKQPVPGIDDLYNRSLIHDGIGCVAGQSAKVVGNNIIFLSSEGLMMLKPNYFKLESMNVQRIDFPIKNEITSDEDACALTYDSQYWITFPQKKVTYRLYHESGMWVKDVSSKLNFHQYLQYGNDVYNLTLDGSLYKHDNTVYNDCDEIYALKIESKSLDLSASFNYKKLKTLYILAGIYAEYFVTVIADGANVLDPVTSNAIVGSDGYVTWQVTTSANVIFPGGSVLGKWNLGKDFLGTREVSVDKKSINGKCRRIKIRYEHVEDKPCEIFGFGLEFKLKKP